MIEKIGRAMAAQVEREMVRQNPEEIELAGVLYRRADLPLNAEQLEQAGAVKVGYFRDEDGFHMVAESPVFPEGVTTWTGLLLPDKEAAP